MSYAVKSLSAPLAQCVPHGFSNQTYRFESRRVSAIHFFVIILFYVSFFCYYNKFLFFLHSFLFSLYSSTLKRLFSTGDN